MADRKRLGGEPQEKKEQHWVLSHGMRQQWLLVTVRHGKEESLALYPLRVMVKIDCYFGIILTVKKKDCV